MKRLLLLLIAVCLLAACLSGKPAPKTMTVQTAPHYPTAQWNANSPRPDDPPPVFPKSPFPSHLIVLDGQALDEPLKLLLLSLQGVLAKTEPRLYFSPGTLPSYDPAHEQEGRWLAEMQNKWGVTSETASDPWAVFDSFAGEVAGFIVYDPDLPQTINVATTLAGIHHAVIAHPDLIDELTARGLTAIEDLRGRFADNVALYTWAFANVWPLANHEIMAFLDDTLHPLRDYLVENNVFTVQLDPHQYLERPLLDQILAETPQNIPVLGWPIDELLGVILFSRNGKFLVCTDFVSNLSAHSGLPRPTLSQEHITEWPTVENKIHVAFAFTDGDSLSYANRWMADWFDDPAYGQIPLGWELSWSLVDLAPDVISYFYDRLDANDFVIGPASGIGYVYPNQYPDLDTFLQLTRPYMEMTDTRTIWVINDDLTFPDAIADQYAAALDLLGIYIDYWPNADKGWYITDAGTPVLRSQYVYLVGSEQMSTILTDAATEKQYLYPDVPTFIFIGVNAWVVSPSMIQTLIDGLDDRYVVLRPDAMFAAMRTAYTRGWLN
jgi:hypothetical protein